MHSLKQRGRMVAIAAAVGLLAAACGSDPDPIDASAGAEQAVAPASETPSDTVSEPEEAAPEVEGPSPASDHLFPDLNTVNIADGSSLNLAEQLAGGDTPVLLWFFAPH